MYYGNGEKANEIYLYIILDILVYSIVVYFYESRSILASPKGESKYKWREKILKDNRSKRKNYSQLHTFKKDFVK